MSAGHRHKAHQAVAHLVDTGRAWISSLRLRALIWVVGIALATTAAILLTSASWVPVVGVAIAAAAVSINKVAAKLSKPVCWGCGHDLTGVPVGEHGGLCPNCGSVHQPRPRRAAADAAIDPDRERA